MIKTYDKGRNIILEGELGTEAYLIKEGQVSVWRESNGEKIHLAVKVEGDIVGEMSLLDDTECTATVTADTPLKVQVITRGDLEKMLDQADPMLGKIIRQLMESVRSANDLIEMYSSRNEEE